MKKFINIIKKNIVFIIILIIIYFVFTFNLPFYIEAPGGLVNINDRYKIENSYNVKGSINMTYVSELRGTVMSYLIAKMNRSMDIVSKNEVIPSNETEKEANFRGTKMLKEAIDNAVILAYKKAGKEVKIESNKLLVTYIDKEAKTNLKIKDQIISIDDKKVNSKEDIYQITKNKKTGDTINIEVINNNKHFKRTAKILKGNIIGIMISYERVLKTTPKIKLNYENSESGSSGGLMTSLAIYNLLVKEDITKGKIISGTGTIDEEGSVGEIDGIKYKLKGAIKNKADVFLAPKGDNYNEAMKLKKKNNYNIKIIEVSTFDDALEYLKKM